MTSHPYYDPEVRAFLESQPTLGTVNADTLESARNSRLLRNEGVTLSDEVERIDHYVPGPDGSEIRVRVHSVKHSQELKPALYWTHGGGFVLGTPEQDDDRFDRWCQRFGLVDN